MLALSWTLERTASTEWGRENRVIEMLCIYYLCIYLHGTPGVCFLDFSTIKMRGSASRCSIDWLTLNRACHSLSPEIITLNHWKLAFLHVKSGQMPATSHQPANVHQPLDSFLEDNRDKGEDSGGKLSCFLLPTQFIPFLWRVTFRKMKLWLLLIAAHGGGGHYFRFFLKTALYFLLKFLGAERGSP